MRAAALALVVVVAAGAAGIIAVAFTGSEDRQSVVVVPATATSAPPAPTPLPSRWIDALARTTGDPELLACRDANGDDALSAADGLPLRQAIPLQPGACEAQSASADFYEEPLPEEPCARDGPPPVLVVAVVSGGSDLLDASEGESLGFAPILNALDQRAREGDVPLTRVVSTAAVLGAREWPQTNMEIFIAALLRERLDATPCLRAVILGHSHGGATVTSVMSVLDDAYAERLLGVIVDRTVVLYDRPAEQMPARTRILNFFQLNEGWHGVPIEAPNVANFDESAERAPIAASDGGGGPALVSHKTLDDAPATQQRIVDEIMRWALGR